MVMNNTPLTPLDRGETIDLEKMNFLAWYCMATAEDMVVARRNNAAKLDELKEKYRNDVEFLDIVGLGVI